MIALCLLVSLTVLPFVTAQSDDTALQLKAIEAHFTQSQIVPSLLTTFDPSALLSVNYAGESLCLLGAFAASKELPT